jgi:dolichyl-phosphate-mannose--protein O-mannosyl transferase
LGWSSLIFAGILEFWLLGGAAVSSFSFFRYCGLRFVGLIGFLFENWLEWMAFSGKPIVRGQVLVLHNFLR